LDLDISRQVPQKRKPTGQQQYEAETEDHKASQNQQAADVGNSEHN